MDAINDANMQAGCGVRSRNPNPSWPSGVSKSESKYTENEIKAGAWTVKFASASTLFLLDVPLQAASTPSGWSVDSNYQYTKASTRTSDIGKMRVNFYGNDKTQTTLTAMGLNVGDGTLTEWTADSSWLCSGYTLYFADLGKVTKDAIFKSKEAGNTFLTWFLRILGFCLCWFAFSLLAGPCEVVAECVPCIGPCLGDLVEAIACFVAYFPSCACCMLICGIVWVVMRPMVGVPLMLISLIMIGGFIAWKVKKQRDKANGKAADEEEGPPPETVGDKE